MANRSDYTITTLSESVQQRDFAAGVNGTQAPFRFGGPLGPANLRGRKTAYVSAEGSPVAPRPPVPPFTVNLSKISVSTTAYSPTAENYGFLVNLDKISVGTTAYSVSAENERCAGGAWVAGKVGDYAIEFTSSGTTNEKIQVVSSSAFYEGGDPQGSNASFTIAGWISSSATNAYQGFISKQNRIPYNGWTLGTWNNNQFVFQVSSGSYNYARGGDSSNGWAHVVGVRRPQGESTLSKTELWVNGTLVQSRDLLAFADSGDSIQLGKYYTNSDLYTAQGRLDEVGYWDVDLDQASIESLYSGSLCSAISSSNLQLYYSFEEGAGNSTVIDRSGNEHSGTLTNMPTGSCL